MKFPTEKFREKDQIDFFGHSKIADQLLKEILTEMQLPNNFGIFGNWGTGKTSLLKCIQYSIETKKEYSDIEFVHFDAWKYEYAKEGDLIFALLSEIKTKLKIEDTSPVWSDLAGVMVGASYSLLNNLLNAATLKLVSLDDIEKKSEEARKAIFEDQSQWVDDTNKLNSQFSGFITNGLKGVKKKKLFIFIDDLDRCLPDNAVKLLEAIKNFLQTTDTLFIVALDLRVVSAMIEAKYHLYDGYGREYLTKILHYSFTLPAPQTEDVVKEIFTTHNIVNKESAATWIASFSKRFISEPRKLKHLLFQFFVGAKMHGIDLTTVGEERIKYIFLANYLSYRWPMTFNGDLGVTRKNLVSLIRMVEAERNSDNDKYASESQKISLSQEDKRVLAQILQNKVGAEDIIKIDDLVVQGFHSLH